MPRPTRMGGRTAAVFESLLDSESNNIAVDDSNTFTKKDYNRTDGGALKSIAEDDETLQASLSVMISNFDDTPTGTQSCLLTGYGIGRATNPTDDPESAFVPYCYENGTSMAAPLVAGCTAEIAALHPEYSPLQLRGIVCGGTTPLANESDQSKIASGGRFTFAAALDDAEVNANTWSITTSGTSVTVHGYNLDGASLFVDQDTVAITPTAQSESEITFTADPALFDGESHRFDVTDGATGRTYKAAYVMPDGQADTLVRVHYLPDVADAATVALVSTPDRLFLADQYGTFFYSCTDPTDASSAWTKLPTPRIPWTSTGGENRAPMAFAYANGKIYAFASDNEGTSLEIAAIYCTVYDIATGAWSACTQIGSVDTGAVAALSACAVDGRVYCSVVEDDQVYSSTSVVLFACSSDGSTFIQSEVTIPDDGNLSATLHVVNGALYGFIEPKQAKDWQEYQASLAYCNLSTSTFVSVGTLDAYGTTDDYFFVRGLLTRVQTAVGNGIVVAGQNTDGCSGYTAGLGDLQLVGTDAGVTGLGSYGLEPAADGFTVGAMAMFKDKLYLEAIDLSVGIKAPALYTLPASGASRLASTDVIETAAVGTPTTGADAGGTATVTDWRGEASSALSVRMGDTAIWTATPQTGYHFVGWYDEDGNEVSTAATYAVPVDSAMTLTAQFAADPAPTPSTPTPAPTSASTSTTVIPAETPASGNAATLPYTGDPLAPFAVVPSALASSALAALCLIAAAGTLLLRTRRNDQR